MENNQQGFLPIGPLDETMLGMLGIVRDDIVPQSLEGRSPGVGSPPDLVLLEVSSDEIEEIPGVDLLTGMLATGGTQNTLNIRIANNEEIEGIENLLDLDGNGVAGAFSDGIMAARLASGLRGEAVTLGAVAEDATRRTPEEIQAFYGRVSPFLDVDGNGVVGTFSDIIMIIRDLAGLNGEAVTTGAVALDATRTDPADIEAYIGSLLDGTVVTPEPETMPVVEVSPANGEEMVNLTRETVVRFGEKVDPATVNDDSFFLIANGERVGGRIVVSSTEEFATFFYDESLPASTEVRVVVAGDEIIGRDGDAIDADGDGNPGGTLTADFRTLPLTRIEGTDVFGFVFDSFNTNADGSNIPIVGATIRVDAFPEANAVTDENGFFRLSDVPAPEFSVHIDGSTASNAPEGTVYATVGKLFESVPGQETQLTMDGETFDIFLPPLVTGDIQELSPTEDTPVGFGDAGTAQLEALFPDVDASLWELTQVTFPAGSAQDEDGNAATQATIIPVDPERLPAPLPPGVELPLVISIQAGGEAGFSQAGGATNFDVPAPVSFPNLDGLAPGEKSLIISFDHDRGEWIPVGSGTVSSDGTIIESDPGVGILAPGWHGVAPGAIGGGDVPFTFGDPNRPDPPPSDPNEPVPPSDPNEPVPPSDPNEPVPLGGRHFFVLENLETGFIFRGFANLVPGEALCGDGVILSPNTSYRQWVFNVDNGLIGFSEFATPASGDNFDLPDIILESDSNPDGDGDGLSDTAEFIIGTSSDNPDSDNDGINDGAEIQLGLEPLDDLSFPTGIISSLPLQGEANAVVVAGSTLDGQGQTAYVATGSQGLAIVDASVFNNPIVLGQLDLSGDATDVAVDANLQIAAVASNGGGLQLVDVSDPMVPTTSNTVNISANQVEIADGIAYATVGNALRAIDLLTGEELQSLTISGEGTILGLAREGTKLYSFGSGTFSVIDIANEGVASVEGQLSVEASNTANVFAGNGVAYLTGGGFRTIDVSDPSTPSLISDADLTFTARGITANGSGLALVAAEDQGLGIYDVMDPQDTDALVTQVNTPGFALDVAIASGIAYVADSASGLQVINYLPFDNQGVAPTVAIGTSADVDPNASGIQVVEGSNVPITADVVDDVQVRNVELLVNGEVVGNDVSFPFDLAAVAPNIAPGVNEADIQVRATDTGGNSTLSNVLTLDLLEDTFAPEVVSTTPTDGSSQIGVSSITVRFNEAIDTSVVNLSGIGLTNLGEDGVLGGGDDTLVNLQTLLTPSSRRLSIITENILEVGNYQLTVDPSIIADRAGNFLELPFSVEFTSLDNRLADGVTINSSIDFVDEEESFIFSGSAGDAVTIGVDHNTGGSVRLLLFNSDGELLRDTGFSGFFQEIIGFIVPSDGNYTVLVDGQDGTIGDYTIALSNLGEDSTTALAGDGSTVSAALDFITDEDFYTFSGSAGDPVTIGVDDNTGGSVRLLLFNSDGEQLRNTGFLGNFREIIGFILPSDGNYTVLVDGQGGTIGDYTIALSNLGEDSTTALAGDGSTVSAALDFITDEDFYTFSGSAGDAVTIGVDDNTGGRVRLILFNSDGEQLRNTGFLGNFREITGFVLPSDGNYTVLVDGQGGTIGDYTISLTTA